MIKDMKIDFNGMPEAPKEHFKGGEGVMMSKIAVSGEDKIMRNRLLPGSSIGLHTHDDSSEAIFIISGHGKAIYDGREEKLGPGDCTFCPKDHEHTLINDGDEDLCFYAFVPFLGA